MLHVAITSRHSVILNLRAVVPVDILTRSLQARWVRLQEYHSQGAAGVAERPADSLVNRPNSP